jgi:ribosomal protein S18 acetylase RimI-like enzyme
VARVRELGPEALARIGEIDRSEHADGYFVLEGGGLRRVERELEIPTWDDAELADTLARLRHSLATGGVLLGVVDDERLVAAAMLGGELLAGETRRLELVFLHVSRAHRRLGLARELLDEVCLRARERGAEQLYVSSSDVEPAVRFYLARGCELASQTDAAMVERWPTDIHLTLDL